MTLLDAEELFRELRDAGFYFNPKVAVDGSRVVGITPMIYTWAIISTTDALCFDDRWCYVDYRAALTALDAWDARAGTEPEGWHRHPKTGRRRPAGDVTREFIHV